MNRGPEDTASILVIEDDKDIARMLAMMLELHGHNAQVVHTGADALKCLCAAGIPGAASPDGNNRRTPDLLLLDLQLSDTDGVALVRQVQELGCAVPPIIVLSAKGPGVVAGAANALGAADYFVKPADMDRLMSSVEKALS